MKPETRIKRFLNEIKRKYGIKDKINIRIIKKENKRRHKPLMEIDLNNTPTIYVNVNNHYIRFEKLGNHLLKNSIAHELIHFLIYKCQKEKDPKKLHKILKLIDRLIDCR